MPSPLDAPTILVVCTGNVCRSPYLERRLQASLDASWGREAIRVRSAGTGSLSGRPMEAGSLDLLAAVGLDGGDFIARDVTKDLLSRAALVITAGRAHRSLVTRIYPRGLRVTHALRDLAQLSEGIELPLPTPGIDASGWLDLVVPLLAARRGVEPPLPEGEADIVDPYRQDRAVFDLMAAQIDAALPPLLRVLGRPRAGQDP